MAGVTVTFVADTQIKVEGAEENITELLDASDPSDGLWSLTNDDGERVVTGVETDTRTTPTPTPKTVLFINLVDSEFGTVNAVYEKIDDIVTGTPNIELTASSEIKYTGSEANVNLILGDDGSIDNLWRLKSGGDRLLTGIFTDSNSPLTIINLTTADANYSTANTINDEIESILATPVVP